ncbi:hypothetical protein NDU88_007318 [Pleurodeles waltl]|uniref:Uncharacterized protein n=1 Tax=Pleurodeles waltl TaxID=8319 RepID=A0AAV7PKX0_PLEWA|nr:hypothetical protein NDU88_007318 [Pleurodeles waltl]
MLRPYSYKVALRCGRHIGVRQPLLLLSPCPYYAPLSYAEDLQPQQRRGSLSSSLAAPAVLDRFEDEYLFSGRRDCHFGARQRAIDSALSYQVPAPAALNFFRHLRLRTAGLPRRQLLSTVRQVKQAGWAVYGGPGRSSVSRPLTP